VRAEDFFLARRENELPNPQIEMERRKTVSGHLEEIKAHAEKLSVQLEEAKAQLRAIEARHKEKEAQAEIDALKTKAHEIDKKHHTLKTIGELATAAVIKSEIEADLAKLKGGLEHFGTKAKGHSATK
jgi:phage shock protein A